MKLPLWTIIPAVGLISAFFLVVPHLNYYPMEWFYGNGIISLGIGLIYIGEGVKKKWLDQ